MNKTVKVLLEADGLLLGAKILSPMIPNAILGIALPQYMVAMISIGILSTGYYRYKAERSKIKEKELSENDLFELED